MNNAYESYKYGVYDGAEAGTRWATVDEITGELTRVVLSDEHYPTCGLPMLSDAHAAYVDGSDTHTLIMGSTGSKKSRLFVMPMIQMMARAGESVIVTDPKGELYARASGLFIKEGYKLAVINLRDPQHSHCWNPLSRARAYFREGQEERSSMIVNDLAAVIFDEDNHSHSDPFWQQSAGALFKGLCNMLVEDEVYVSDECVTLHNVQHLADKLNNDDGGSASQQTTTNNILDLMPDSFAAKPVNSTIHTADRTFTSIMVSFNVPMQKFFSQHSLINMLSYNEVDFASIGQTKTALFLILPDEKTTLHGIASIIVKQCYEDLIYTAQKFDSGMLPVRVNFLLDEFSNMPSIPDMPAMISAARSRNMRFYLVIQSMHQLSGKYGLDTAQTIKGNCENWVFLTSRELTLLNEISQLCGVDSATGKPLISVSQLQRLNKDTGEALILCKRLYPYIAHLPDIDEYRFPRYECEPLPKFAKPKPPVISLYDWERALSMKELIEKGEASKLGISIKDLPDAIKREVINAVKERIAKNS